MLAFSFDICIEKFHKVVLFRLLNVKLFGLNYLSQSPLLESYKLLPYRMRLFSRISIFCHKVINKIILSDFSNNLVFKTNCFKIGIQGIENIQTRFVQY